MGPRPITHVIFDCDGLLLDTEHVYTVCIQKIVGRYGKTFSWDVKKQMMGRKLLEASTIALQMLEIDLDPQAFVTELNLLLEEGFRTVPAMPGVEKLIRHLKGHNVPLAIATSSGRAHFEIKASIHRAWIDLFDVIVCGDDPEISAGKPAPDMFLTAARRLGASPATCLVFEDAPNGIEAAVAAKMASVAIPDPNIDKESVAQISGRRVPVILTNTVVTKWKAMQWTPESLAKNVKVLINARNGTDQVFVPASNAKGLFEKAPHMRKSFTVQNISMDHFLEKQGTKGEYYYYSGVLADWGTSVMKDIAPFDKLLLDQERGVPTVWFGHAGVTANIHHDRSHNFFVQVYGTKRWLMFPPTEWASLYHYPFLHPHYQQSQVDLRTPDLSKYPSLPNVMAYEAIVKPGDVLYVPPYWYHYVEGGDSTAISLAFLSPSPEEEALGQLSNAPAPWPESFTLSQRVAIARSTISLLIDALYGEESSANFVEQVLLETRYRNLMSDLLTRATLMELLTQTRCFANETQLSFATYEQAPQPMQLYMEGVVSLVMDKLKATGHVTENKLTPGVAEIVLGNYIEVLARAAVGINNAPAFLAYCFPTADQLIQQQQKAQAQSPSSS